jgi:hypothetical protein
MMASTFFSPAQSIAPNMTDREGSYKGRMSEYIAKCLDLVRPLIDLTGSTEQQLITLAEFTADGANTLYDLLLTLQQIEENRCANSGDQK